MTLLTILAVATLAAALGALAAALVRLSASERDLRRTESRLEAMGDTLDDLCKRSMAVHSLCQSVPGIVASLDALRRRGMAIKDGKTEGRRPLGLVLDAVEEYYGGELNVPPRVWGMLDAAMGYAEKREDAPYDILKAVLRAEGMTNFYGIDLRLESEKRDGEGKEAEP